MFTLSIGNPVNRAVDNSSVINKNSKTFKLSTVSNKLSTRNHQFYISDFMKPLFVSYYTEGAGYEKYLDAHAKSLEQFGLECAVYKMPKAKNWREGGRLVAKFLVKMLKIHTRPLCYIDIDTIIVDDPLPKLQISEDIGYSYHYVDKKSGYVLHGEGVDYEVLSGTLFVNSTPGALKFIQRWDELMQKNTQLTDQQALEKLLYSPQKTTTAKLHRGLCAIEETHDFFNDQYIRHFQASRGKEHALTIASTDTHMEQQAKKYGYNFLLIKNLDNVYQQINEPTLILERGAQIHRRLFNVECFEKEIGLAISCDGGAIDPKVIYVTPTESCSTYLKTSKQWEEAQHLVKLGLVERIPSSYWSSLVKSPTISFKKKIDFFL